MVRRCGRFGALVLVEYTAYTISVPTASGLSSSGQQLTAFDPNRVVQARNLGAGHIQRGGACA